MYSSFILPDDLNKINMTFSDLLMRNKDSQEVVC